MAIGAKPFGARSSVEPMMTIRNMKVMTISQTRAETSEYPPGECSAITITGKTGCHIKACSTTCNDVEDPAPSYPSNHLGDDIRDQVFSGETSTCNQSKGNCRVQMAALRCGRWQKPWSVTVRPKAKATPSRPMPTLGKAAARTALPQPPRTSQNVPNEFRPKFSYH